MREAMLSAILVVPLGVPLDLTTADGASLPEGGCPRTRTVPTGTVYRPALLERSISKEARSSRLIQLQDGFAFVDGEGDVHTLPFGDVVGVETCPEGRVLYSRHGCVVPVTSDLWRRVDTAVARIDEHVPQYLRFDSPDRIGVGEAEKDAPRWMVAAQRWQWIVAAAVSVYMAWQAASALLPELTLTEDVYFYSALSAVAAGGSYWRYRRDNKGHT